MYWAMQYWKNKKQAEECDFFLLKLHSALRIAALFAYTPLQGEGK